MNLEALLNQVKQMIFDDPTTPHRADHDPSGLMGRLEGVFGQFGQFRGQQADEYGREVQPARMDPYGDPADTFGQMRQPTSYPYVEGNVRPASEDPLGDPADQYGTTQRSYPNVRPASEDPLGDPADQERRRW